VNPQYANDMQVVCDSELLYFLIFAKEREVSDFFEKKNSAKFSLADPEEDAPAEEEKKSKKKKGGVRQ
jgi:hypothetical protein